MRYEWNEAKAAHNLRKHGISFAEAQTVFDDPLFMDFYDPEHSRGEHRYIILGESAAGTLLMVSYTERADAIRLISTRKATPKERRAYERR